MSKSVFASATILAVAALTMSGVPAAATEREQPSTRHVILISVDGMHQSDLAWYVATNPGSAFGALVRRGVEFTQARTPVPSDSFPGLIAQVTGGNPQSTGIYYDDSWNRSMFPPGTTSCVGAAPGAEVTYFEQADRDPSRLDAGQGLAGLPGSILRMTGDPRTLIDPAQLPVDAATCRPVFPHQYLQVNTIFEVVRAAGLRTAWSDKHPAYEILNGPSGAGVQDLFTPEINSDATAAGDWTKDNASTMQYDDYKVQAVINQIDGFDHSGTSRIGTPALFGMNFQSVSTAEKLPSSDGLTGGYLGDGSTPGPLLARALRFVDSELGRILAAIQARGLDRTTAILLSAKHGQSPQTPSALTRISDGQILGALDTAWNAAGHAGGLVAMSIDDDAMVIWLKDRSQAAADFAKSFLLSYSGTGNDISGNPKAFTASGLSQVFAGRAAAEYFTVNRTDPRVPDIYGITQYGVVYTSGQGKIAEHGGANPQDLSVPLVVSGAGIQDAGVNRDRVETTQIAPTILKLLGLNPNALKSVRIEHTTSLPLGD